MKIILHLPILLVLTSCAIGPITLNETARTNGEGQHSISAAYGSTDFSAKWNYGLTKNLDVGLQVETLSQGIRAKYALLNQSEGSAVAVAAGSGISMGGNHFYLDSIYSSRASWFEPYLAYRFMWVNSNKSEFNSRDTNETILKIKKDNYHYGQFFLGTRFHFNKSLFASIEISSLQSLTDVRVTPELFYNFSLGFKF